MSKLRIGMALSFLVSICANAQGVFTGNQLVDYCAAPEGSEKWALCMGYINGFVDGNLKEPSFNGYPSFCLPNGVTGDQLKSVFTKYLLDNPQKLHCLGFTLISVALWDAFPCK